MHGIRSAVRCGALCALASVLGLAAAAEDSPPGSAGAAALAQAAAIFFEPGPPATRAGAIEALAYEASSGRLALGGARGAWLLEPDGRVQNVLPRGPVHALALGPGGELWIGTENGLLLRDTEGHLLDRTPAPGTAARAVTALAVAPGAIAAATGDGVHVTTDGRVWERLMGALPDSPASGVALRAREGALELWWIARHEIWRARLASDGPRLRALDAAQERPFGSVSHLEPVHVAVELPGIDVAIVSGDTIAWRTEPRAAWQTASADVLPGATASRIGCAGGRLWLATDRGLLEAAVPGGPWRRAAPPAGGEPALAVVGDAGRVFAATAQGLLTGRPAVRAPRPPLDALPLADPRPGEPSVGEVQRAALVYLDLGPERVRRLRGGVALRGLLPLVTFDLDRSHGRDAKRGWDQSFVSGATRQLLDQGYGRSRDTSATLRFTWNLGDVAYDPEEIDLSKEARALIELRDDVLDEITQLYFERRRVLLDLTALAPGSGLEAARLQLRADELAAQLDAWTGGWFGRRAPPLAR